MLVRVCLGIPEMPLTYYNKHYIDALLGVARFALDLMVSFQAAFAVICTGMFAVKIMQAYQIPQPIIDSVFVPCGIYFWWALCISGIDSYIERDVL